MLWASDVLGRDGKPAVLLLNAARAASTLTAEVAYVAADLPAGPVEGRYFRSADVTPEPLTLEWPAAWPAVSVSNKLHPRQGTPEEAVTVVNGDTRIRLRIHRGGPI